MNKKLKARIIEHFGSQWAFAQAVKMHESDVSRVVRGRKELSLEMRQVWGNVLKTDPQNLFIVGG